MWNVEHISNYFKPFNVSIKNIKQFKIFIVYLSIKLKLSFFLFISFFLT